MEKRYTDTHMHTRYSDGDLAPVNNLEEAKRKGLNMVAITDHDNLSGSREAIALAQGGGEIDVIPGVEVSVGPYHILGLDFDIDNKGFEEFIEWSRTCQNYNNRMTVENIRGQGVPIEYQIYTRSFPSEHRLGSGNLVSYLFQSTLHDKMSKEFFVGKGIQDARGVYEFVKQFKYQAKHVEPVEAIREIHKAGGMAFIAHPFKDVDDMKEMDFLMQNGLDGLEIQPNYADRNAPFVEYAREHNLPVVFGSDYHDFNGKNEKNTC